MWWVELIVAFELLMAALVKKLHIVPVRRVPNDDHKYRPSSYEVCQQHTLQCIYMIR